MSNEETQTNDLQGWCGTGCCGPSDSDINMKEVMEQCSQMKEKCRTEWSSRSAKESEADYQPPSQ
ncbi:MAG: hypothetical protein ACXABY_21660 [Candidatus Thorarchaeota archaeon]